MNDLQWLYWDRDSAQDNQRQRRVMDMVRVLGLTPSQVERFLMLEPGDLTQWCKGLISNRYAAMRLVRIHRVVQRNRDYLPPRHQMPDWLSRRLANGQSGIDVLSDPYFLEHRLERIFVVMARQCGASPASAESPRRKSAQVIQLMQSMPT